MKQRVRAISIPYNKKNLCFTFGLYRSKNNIISSSRYCCCWLSAKAGAPSLQGAGKTTFAGKLANKLKKEENARPLMIAADIYRPAAIDQLKTLGQQIDVPVFALGTEVPAVEIVRQGLEQAQANHNDYVLIDTAGRLRAWIFSFVRI